MTTSQFFSRNAIGSICGFRDGRNEDPFTAPFRADQSSIDCCPLPSCIAGVQFEFASILGQNTAICSRRPYYPFSEQVYKRAVQGGLRDLGVVNRLSWAQVVVEDPGKRAPYSCGAEGLLRDPRQSHKIRQ